MLIHNSKDQIIGVLHVYNANTDAVQWDAHAKKPFHDERVYLGSFKALELGGAAKALDEAIKAVKKHRWSKAQTVPAQTFQAGGIMVSIGAPEPKPRKGVRK